MATRPQKEDLNCDLNSILEKLLYIASRLPDMKNDSSFLEDLKVAIRLCWICNFSNGKQLVQVLETCFARDLYLMFSLGHLYAVEVHENAVNSEFGKLSSVLEYMIRACVRQKSRLYVLMAKGANMKKPDDWMAAHLLLFHALHRGSFQDLFFLFRHGITFHGFLKPKADIHIPKQIPPHRQSLTTLHLLFDTRKACEFDLQQVMTAYFNSVPYPFVSAEHLRLNGTPNDFTDKIYTPLFPAWSAGPPQPRALKHLARCAVRDRLRDCFRLPDGIDELPVDQTLKEYIDLSINENGSFQCLCLDCQWIASCEQE